MEVFFRQVQIPLEISYQRELFGVTDIIKNQYVVRTKCYFLNSSLCQEVINLVTSISIQIWNSYQGCLGYQNIFCLPKGADRIHVKGLIVDKIFGDCMKKK